MKQLLNRTAIATKAILVNALAAYGQDTTNRLPAAETSPATWMTRPWFWVAGLLILVAIYMMYARWARKRNERRSTGSPVGE
jgi:formate-dependent nitrite reductase membrane component NrfD